MGDTDVFKLSSRAISAFSSWTFYRFRGDFREPTSAEFRGGGRFAPPREYAPDSGQDLPEIADKADNVQSQA